MSRLIFGNLLVLYVALSLFGCDMQRYPDVEDSAKKELLIYSGMTMVQPLMEVVALVEEEQQCRIKITYGGSGHICKSVEVNQLGDIFFPGCISYIEDFQSQGIVTDAVQVGYNEAVLFVEKGNPQQVESQLDSLYDQRLNVVIGNDTSGAIGRETKRMLDAAGIYQQVADNVLYMTTDSKGLALAMKNRDADVVVNWKAIAYLPANREVTDVLKLPKGVADKRPLVMGLLRYSKNPDLARKVLAKASSIEGQAIFRKYGFLDD